MAAKTADTYLRFNGGTTEQKLRTIQSPSVPAGSTPDSDGNMVITFWFRLLEWPVSASMIFQRYGADIISNPGGDFSLFFVADEFAKTQGAGRLQTGEELCFGFVYSTNSGVREQIVPANTGGVKPFKLGTLHKVTYVVHVESSVAHAALFVDDVSVWQDTLGTALDGNSTQNDDFLIAGTPFVEFGEINGNEFGDELAIWELYQMKSETGRTDITVTSGDIDLPDSGLDPWTQLEVDADAEFGWVIWLEEGTGTVVKTEATSNIFNLSGSIAWADETKVDPQIDESARTGTWSFENTKDYPILGSDAADVSLFPVFAPSDGDGVLTSEVRLRGLPAIWAEHGARRAQEWADTSGLTGGDTGEIAHGEESIKADNASSVVNPKADLQGWGAGAATKEVWLRAWFYDKDVGTDTDVQQRLTLRSATDIEQAIGIQGNQSLDNYYLREGDTTGVVDSGVARSTGWREFLIFISDPTSGDTTVRFYIDGSQVHESTTVPAADPMGTIPAIRLRSDSADDLGWWDWMACNTTVTTIDADFKGLVAPTGILAFPALQPVGDIVSFDSVTFTDEAAGTSTQEVGTLLHEFRHNDGGGFGAWTTLNDTNLQALTTGGGGADIIEVRVDMDSGMDDMSSPALRQVTINWTTNIIPRIMHQRRQMAGC